MSLTGLIFFIHPAGSRTGTGAQSLFKAGPERRLPAWLLRAPAGQFPGNETNPGFLHEKKYKNTPPPEKRDRVDVKTTKFYT